MLKQIKGKVVLDVESKLLYRLDISDFSFAILLCNEKDCAYIKDGKLWRGTQTLGRYTNELYISSAKPVLIEGRTPYLKYIIKGDCYE